MTVVGPNAGAAARPAAIEVVVAGAAGRMGHRVIACLREAPGLRLAAALEAPGHAALGRDAGDLAGLGRLGVAVGAEPGAAITRERGLVGVSVAEAAAGQRPLLARAG